MNTNESPEQGMSKSRSQPPPMRPARFSISNLSIKHRLPLLIGTLLFGIIVTCTWASYRGVKESALEVGRERLGFLTQQLATLFQQSSSTMANKTLTVANEPAIRTYLHSPVPRSPAGVIAVLQQFMAPQDPSSLQIELWSADQSLALALPENSSQVSADLNTEFTQSASGPLFSALGAIRLVRETLAYPVVAAVKDDEGQVTGYLVRWRKLVATAAARQQFVDLIGTQAALYIGNDQGDIWTNLVSIAPKPPVDVRLAKDITHYTREGNYSVIALARPVTGTPWFVLVEFADEAILAQADRFLWRLMVISIILLVIALATALALSRSITRPLHSLTKAALAISDGNYSHIVDIRTRDELGTLARAFNTMVVKVRDSQRELEQKVQQRTGQLQAANKELEAFSYSVSHDLRAPLRHINGFSQALLEDYSDKLDEVGKDYLRQVRGASQEMAQLIDDVLQLARVTRSELRRETVNLSEKARAVVDDLQKTEPERTVVVKIEEGLSTHGDKRLLQIMLSNLLGNAWKFTSKRQQAEISFGQEQNDGQTCYFVRDNGAGFDMAYVNKLFGAFQRLHSAGEFEGTGIGLATVQRIVNRHGGRVWAEAAVNEGAAFYFTLPDFKEIKHGEQSDLTG